MGETEAADLDWLVETAAATHAGLVSGKDLRVAAGLLREAGELFASPASVAALAQFWDFLQCPPPMASLEVAPYAHSRSCEIICGCAFDDIIVLGVHPGASAVQILGVLIHEAVHWTLDHRPHPLAADELVNDALSEALATALGGAWFVAQIAGDVPARAWYDNEAVDALARRIYPKVSSGIGRGEPLDLLLPGLIADISASENGALAPPRVPFDPPL